MKKKIISIGVISLIIILSIIINDNVKDKSKIISYNGDSLMVSIDGENKGYLPNSGNYYLTDYECDNSNTKVSWDRTNYKLDVSNSTSEGNVYCNLTFKSKPLLSEMPVGSYVAYIGKGGTVGSTSVSCSGNACTGANANQSSDTSTYGYCYDSNYKYYTTGWRIAYIKDNKATLVSSGAPECASRTSSTANATYINTANALALKYCNTDYVDGSCTCTSSTSGQCSSKSTDAWAINDYDFYYMTKAINGFGKRLANDSNGADDSLGDIGGYLYSILDCRGSSYKECGYNNDLIDNGGYYWFAARYSSSTTSGMIWLPNSRYASNSSNNYAYGLRPVINLSSSVYVTGGDGTMESPYTIDVDFSDKPLLTTAEVGSYVKYEGNNGCTGDYCSGANDNSCNGNYTYNDDGWRIAYKDLNNAYIISGGAPECMCTDSSGNAQTSCTSYTATSSLATSHINNLNTIASKYCNSTYVEGGSCVAGTNVWAMNASDFYLISNGYHLQDTACYGSNATGTCLDQKGILDINGYYHFATLSGTQSYWWYPTYKATLTGSISSSNGVRPVIKLSSNVVIKSGTGTKTDPYIIVVSKNINNNNDVSGPLLSTMEAGSYVEYVGGNGSTGTNANKTAQSNGWCSDSSYEFNSSGWRVAYTSDGSAHIVSGGAPECVSFTYEASGSGGQAMAVGDHIYKLNNLAIAYCNQQLASGGKCDSTTAWALNGTDYQFITGYNITNTSCFGSSATCSINNPSLIMNGSYYWFASVVGLSVNNWDAKYNTISTSTTGSIRGLRPVIKLDPSIIVTGGTGTADDPYKIAKP